MQLLPFKVLRDGVLQAGGRPPVQRPVPAALVRLPPEQEEEARAVAEGEAPVEGGHQGEGRAAGGVGVLAEKMKDGIGIGNLTEI